MISALRCSVCGRALGMVEDGVNRGRVYCPDRPCIVYPSVASSRPADPTISAWALAVRTTTDVSAKDVSQGLGRSPGWMSRLAIDQLKRWRSAP